MDLIKNNQYVNLFLADQAKVDLLLTKKVNNTTSIPHKAESRWGFCFSPERCEQIILVPLKEKIKRMRTVKKPAVVLVPSRGRIPNFLLNMQMLYPLNHEYF